MPLVHIRYSADSQKDLAAQYARKALALVHFEGTNGVRIVSRDEDIYGNGAGRWLHIFDDSKTIQIRHLQIEKNDVGMKFIDLLHRVYAAHQPVPINITKRTKVKNLAMITRLIRPRL